MAIARPSYASRRLRRILSAWVSEVSGLADAGTQGAGVRVLWAEQNLPRPVLPFITLRERTSVTVNTQQRILTEIPASLDVTILTDVAGTAAAISANYGDYRYVVQPGDDFTAVRDGLAAKLVDGPDPFVTAVLAADAFTLSGRAGALVWPSSAILGVSIAEQGPRTVSVLETTRTTIVRIEIDGASTPDERALDYGDALIADLSRSATSGGFAKRGVSIVGNKPTLTDISALSGGERETRAFFDVQVSQWTRHITEDPNTVDQSGAPAIELQRPPAAL